MLLMGGVIDIAYDLTPLDLYLQRARESDRLFPHHLTTVFFGNNKWPSTTSVRQALCYTMPYGALVARCCTAGKPAMARSPRVLYHKAVSSCKYDRRRSKPWRKRAQQGI
jgi:hypothetical protein